MRADSPSHRIRKVEAAQIGDLIRIGNETNLSPWTAQHYFDELQDRNSIMLRLISDENSTLGFVVGRKILGGQLEPRFDAEIYNIAVTGAEQGRGCGQQLFDAFAKICERDRVERIWLEVRESNEKAIKFYEKNGFEHVQTRNNFYSNPTEPALLMRLSLKKERA